MKLVIVAAIVCFVGAAIVLIIRSRSSNRAPSSVPRGHSENESWVVNRGGEVVEKKAQIGMEKLSAWERLVIQVHRVTYSGRTGTLVPLIAAY